MSATIICAGVIDVAVLPATCSTGWLSIDTGLGFDISTLDPTAILSAFTAGAVVCFVPLSVAWACSFVLSMISGGYRG